MGFVASTAPITYTTSPDAHKQSSQGTPPLPGRSCATHHVCTSCAASTHRSTHETTCLTLSAWFDQTMHMLACLLIVDTSFGTPVSFSTAARTRMGGHGSGRSAAPTPQQRALTVHVDTCLFYSSHVESLPFRDAHRCYGVQAALSCGCRLVSQMLMLLHDCFKRELRMSILPGQQH